MELFKRQEEQHLECRGLSEGAKVLWKKVRQGVRLSFIPFQDKSLTAPLLIRPPPLQLCILAVRIGAHAAEKMGHATPLKSTP
jgi:hypothetical protein